MKFLNKFLCIFSFIFNENLNPFDYELNLNIIKGTNHRTMICFHGYGSSYKIANYLKDTKMIDSTLISFNFPDHDLDKKTYKPTDLSFGTINELLPALYVLKKEVIDEKIDAIDLYGFSSGGGALINILGILNTSSYEKELSRIGITKENKQKILSAIQKGLIILDSPLKSIEEIIELRGPNEELLTLAKNYEKNSLRPIDSLDKLKGLSLNIILHFQKPDEIIFNRDDEIYIEKLKQNNQKGSTSVIFGNDGGHNAMHLSLWKFYNEKIK